MKKSSIPISYRVLLAEDEPLFLNSIKAKLTAAAPDFEICGTAYNGADALEQIHQLQPHLLITDIQMPRMNGLELIRQVQEHYPYIQIIILSSYTDFEYMKEAIRCGIQDYILKTAPIDEMKAVLDKIRSELNARYLKQLSSVLSSRILDPRQQLSIEDSNFYAWASCLNFQMFYIHVGNMGTQYYFPELIHFQENLLTQSQLTGLFEELFPDTGWFYTKSSSGSGGYLLTIQEPGRNMGGKSAAQALYQKLSKAVPCFPVHVLYTLMPCNLTSVSHTARDLQNQCENSRIYGKSLLERLSSQAAFPASLDAKSDEMLQNLFPCGSMAELRQKVKLLISHWTLLSIRFQDLYQHLLFLMRIIRRHSQNLSGEELAHMEYDLIYHFYAEPTLKALEPTLINTLEASMMDMEKESGQDIDDVVYYLKKYLDENYCAYISLNDIAEKYHFTASYLSKSFKKKMQITPLKYVINLRIERAKQLISQNPELSLKEIGIMVGYEDQNYFSRIFKNCTGINPSEYMDGAAR
ncbi:MAG: response regulator [Eubacteriales bacterium]|nr:response regulator [Eubacteriales bacterium]